MAFQKGFTSCDKGALSILLLFPSMYGECLLLIKACLATGTIFHDENEALMWCGFSALGLDSSAGTATNLRALEL